MTRAPDLFKSVYVWSNGMAEPRLGSYHLLGSTGGSRPRSCTNLQRWTVLGRLQRIWHVNIPSIFPTIVIMLILRAGSMMSVGFEKIPLMQNPLNPVFIAGNQHLCLRFRTAPRPIRLFHGNRLVQLCNQLGHAGNLQPPRKKNGRKFVVGGESSANQTAEFRQSF